MTRVTPASSRKTSGEPASATSSSIFLTAPSALTYLFGASGSEVLNRPVLMLLDLNLPDMSGTAILQKLKADETLRRSPVVVLTTTDDKSEIQRCYDLGCNVYITKPVNYEQLRCGHPPAGLVPVRHPGPRNRGVIGTPMLNRVTGVSEAKTRILYIDDDEVISRLVQKDLNPGTAST